MKLVTVLLPEAYLEGLDELVRANMYPSRSSVIRSAVRDLLKKELWEKRGRKHRPTSLFLAFFICSFYVEAIFAAAAGSFAIVISLPTMR